MRILKAQKLAKNDKKWNCKYSYTYILPLLIFILLWIIQKKVRKLVTRPLKKQEKDQITTHHNRKHWFKKPKNSTKIIYHRIFTNIYVRVVPVVHHGRVSSNMGTKFIGLPKLKKISICFAYLCCSSKHSSPWDFS